MNNSSFAPFEKVSYPCYWFGKDGELKANSAALELKNPLFDEPSLREYFARTFKGITFLNSATPQHHIPFGGKIQMQSVIMLPFEDGTVVTFQNAKHSSLSTFTASMREYLSNIFAVLSLLSKKVEDDDLHIVEDLQRNAYNMLRQITNLETISRLESGLISIDSFDINAFLSSMMTSVTTVCINRGVEIRTKLPDTPIYVKSDPKLFEQAFLNALRNSLQFTRDGNVITVSLTVVKNQALVTIDDNGLGIQPQFQDHIFMPYFSVDPYGDTDDRPSMGLGLYVVQRTMKRLGGNVLLKASTAAAPASPWRCPLTRRPKIS